MRAAIRLFGMMCFLPWPGAGFTTAEARPEAATPGSVALSGGEGDSAASPAKASPVPPSGGFPWRIVTADGRDHVTAADVAAFYRFDRWEEDGPAVWFRSPTLVMRWEINSRFLMINGVKFLLAEPCVKKDGQCLLSRLDLVKWVDPVLRPSYLRHAESFDTVVIDPGHGGADPGTRGPIGVEKDFTLSLGLMLREELARRGLKTVMTREDDARLSKTRRGIVATEHPDSIFVSLHFNADRSRQVHGVETYVMTPMGLASSNDGRPGLEAMRGFDGNVRENESLALAAAVHAQVLHRTGAEDRGVRRARFAVLKDCERAGLLIEGGYLTSPLDAERIRNPTAMRQLAAAIAQGILHYRRAIEDHRPE